MEKQTEDTLARNNKIVIVTDKRLPAGKAANRAAVLATGLAAGSPEIVGEPIQTADGLQYPGITKVPVSVLTADGASLPDLAARGRELGCSTYVFVSCAQGLRSYRHYLELVGQMSSCELDIDSVLLYGPHKKVNRVTGNLAALK